MKTKALNPVAKKWVAALRSGKIKQTRNRLGRRNGSRCCLGVLCDLAVKAKIIDGFNIEGGALPPEVREWAGLQSMFGDYAGGCLVVDNDKLGKNFSEIANIIESQPNGLFE